MKSLEEVSHFFDWLPVGPRSDNFSSYAGSIGRIIVGLSLLNTSL